MSSEVRRRRRLFGRAFAFLGGAACVLLVTGCAPTVAMDAAPNATDPACAEIMVRLPDKLEDLDLRETNAQATAAWGSPASVLLSCGLPVQPPTSLPCLPVGTVEWIIDDSNPAYTTATTHGRKPVTQLVINNTENGGQTFLADLETAIAATPIDPGVAPCK
ncbi:hypothetical protein B7R21_16270 [Subtercola boreus]|uniref:DUF3515 domain-containing protein n=1 Tax=Subtercola boreus TaxID=120213 RepID=A0A3E0VBY6_9MICO|nr:DUF3515 domain-containing protein [Subtercola boreus]RFA07209.1 hypothetical protein B7R21_16270 [Subtercola boreus]